MKLPIVALGVAALLALFTISSFVVRTAGGEGGAARVGGDGDISTGGYGGSKFYSEVVAQKVEVVADPSGAIRWTQAEYTAPAGDVTFVVQNPGPVGHQFGVEGNGIKYESPNFSGNTTNSYTIKGLPPGEYQIVCNFSGHKQAGMVSKLIVK